MKDADRAVPAEHCLHIDPALAGRRLDQALAELLPEYSRSRLQRLLDQGLVLVDGRTPVSYTHLTLPTKRIV